MKAILLSLPFLLATPLAAGTFIWDGGSSVDSNITTAINWNPNGAPVSDLANTDLIFAGTTRPTPTLSADFSTRSITFNNTAGAFAFSGSAFLVGTGGITNNDLQTMTFGNSVNFSSVANTTINAASGGLTFNGLLTMPTGTLTVTGAFTTTLGAGASLAVNGPAVLQSNANLTLNGGQLTRDATGVFSLAAGKTLTAQAGGDAIFTGAFTNSTASTITVTGAGSTFSTTGSIFANSGTVLNVLAGGSISITGGGNMNLGNAGGSGTLLVDGAGSSVSANQLRPGISGLTGTATFRNAATGTFTSIQVDNSSSAASDGTLNVESGATLTGGSLLLANQAAANTGAITITGTGSAITLTGAATATIGAASASSGTLNLQSSGLFTSGTGLTTVNATGTVAITGGTYNSLGDLTLNGGQLTRDATGVFSLAAGKTLTAQAGGDAIFTGAFTNSTASTITVTGAGSTLTTTSTLALRGGSTTNVFAGADLIANGGAGTISLATTAGEGNATLTVDGNGSNLEGASLFIAQSGNTAVATFSNGSTGAFTSVLVDSSTTAGTNGTLNIQSGADVTGTSLSLAQNAVANTGVLTITGAGSTLTLTGTATTTIGAASTSSATFTVANGGTFTSGTGLASVRATGNVVIDGGTFQANGVVDLNGTAVVKNAGVLAVPQITGTGGTGVLTFDDGTLRATANSAFFLTGLSQARVRSGGAVIDTNGLGITIAQALVEDAGSPGGGLAKTSAGTLTLNGANTYSGNTTVNQGILSLGTANPGNQSSTVSIANTGATLDLAFSGTDVVGSLFIGTTQMPAGIYGNIGSVLPVIGISQITGSGTVTVDTPAVNDAPTATNLSAAETYTEDIALNLTGIVVSDVDSATVTATLTLSAPSAGSFNTATSAAVTSTYNAGTGVWSASGAIANVNVLLAGLTFTPALNFNSNFTISTNVSDGVAAALTGSKAMTGTAVNDAPTATNLSVAETYSEDTQLNLTGIVASDIDSNTVTATLTLSNTAAGSFNTATSGAVTSTYNAGTGVWSAAGAIADVNTLLAGLVFTPASNFNSSFTVATSVSDGALNVTGTKNMTGTAINDMPGFTKGSDQTAANNAGKVVVANWATGISDGDPEISQTLSFQVTNNNNALFAGQPQISNNGTLTFTPQTGVEGSATVSVTLTDDTTAGGAALTTAVQTFTITVGPADPNILQFDLIGTAGSGLLFGNEPAVSSGGTGGEMGTSITYHMITRVLDLSNVGWGSSQGFTDLSSVSTNSHLHGPTPNAFGNNGVANYTQTAGVLFSLDRSSNALTGGVFTSPSSQITLSSTQATELLNGRYYINIHTANNAGGELRGFLIPVNEPPTITDIADQSVAEDSSTGALAFTIGDTISDAASLTVSRASSNTSLVPTANIVFGGSGANRTVTITPAANQSGTATITITVSDGTLSVSDTFLITVTAVNDAPTATNLSATETYFQNTPKNLTDIVVTDPDSTVTATLTLSTPSAGSLNTGTSGAVTSTYNAGTGVWSASGAVADVNTLLASLTFTPALNFNSAFTITTSISDGVAPAVTGSKNMVPASNNANLSGIAISSGTLSPIFATGTLAYTARVPFSSATLTLTPTTTDANATVTVNGLAVVSGSPSAPIALAVGPNVITTLVTAQNGSTTKTYTVTVTRTDLFATASVDSANTVGLYTSQAIVGGKPSISHYDNTNGDLKYSRNSAADGSGTWTTVTVESSNTVGQYTSLAVLSDGRPVISYYYGNSGDLKFARNSAADGSGTWTTVTVDSTTGTVGQFTSLAVLPDGRPAISYYDVTNGDLKFVVATDTSGTTWATPVTVDSTGNVGQDTSLAIVSGKPAISYYDATNIDLKFVVATDASGTTWATPVTVDSTGTVGQDTSLALLADGRPAISYSNSTSGDLKFARNSSADGSGTWTTVTVDSTGFVGEYTSLTIVDGRPAISYYDGNNTDLKFARASTADGSGTWTSVTVDSSGSVGQYTSLEVLPNGRPAISYYDSTNGDLKWIVPDAVQPAADNALLGGLALSAGTLSPGFGSLTSSYTAAVMFSNSSVTVTPLAADPAATITVNGASVPNGGTSAPVSLSPGSNPITIVVTAPDGVTTRTYTVAVTRNNPGLTGLAISQGTLAPTFSSLITSYSASVPVTTTSLTLTPVAEEMTSTITVNGVPVASGTASGTIALAVGSNAINTVVTAQDGITTRTYTVTVTRAAPNLSGLVLSAGTLSPTFNANTVSYSANVSMDTTGITLTPTVADATSTVTVNGLAVTSGTASTVIPLALGANAIPVVVTAQDGIATKTYTVTVNRAAPNLSALALSTGTLSPVFNATTTSYAVSVPVSASSILVTPTVADPLHTMTVNGTSAVSGNTFGPIPLSPGVQTITIVVTAQDGVTTRTYTVTVTRAELFPATTVDVTGNVGFYTSQAIVGGKPAISYFDNTNGDLKYTRNSAADGSGTWTTVTVDSAGSVGQDTSLAVLSDGRPAISYYDSTNGDLKFARNSAADGSGTWTTVTVDSTGSVGQFTSLAVLSDGRPAISYYDNTNDDLKLVVATNTSGTTWATPITVDSTGDVGQFTSLKVLANGRPAISYYDSTNTDLKFVAATDASGTAWATPVILDSTGIVGQYTSLAIVGGNPAISHYDGTNGDLKYTRNSAADGSGTWTTATVDATDTVGLYTSLAIVGGNPAISYYNSSNGDLKFARNSAADGSGTWTPVTVDSTGAVGLYTSLAVLADGRPAISYFDSTNFDLKWIVPEPVPLVSNTAVLAGLNLSGGTLTPGFGQLDTLYSVFVPFATTSVSITPTAYHPSATIQINGTPLVLGGTASISLGVGANAVAILVTAPDGITTKTYSVNIYRGSSNAGLSSLVPDSTTLAPTFSTNTTSYTATVPYTTGAIALTPTTADATAMVTVNGSPVASGSPSSPIPLAIGSNVITTVVSAQDGFTTKTYTVTVTRLQLFPSATADFTGNVGLYTSQAIVDGKPAISYYDATNGDLKYTRNSAADGSGTWTTVTVDSSNTVGQLSSLTFLPDGRPAISYYDVTNGDLKFVVATDTSGTTWATPITVDGTGTVGQYTSLAVLPDGRPAISYYDVTNGDLKFVVATNTSGTTWATPITVDSTGDVGQFTSLKVLANGRPAISYYAVTNLDLKFVVATDASGSAWAAPVIVDSANTVGQYNSLSVVGGNPAISYYDFSNGDLKYTRNSAADGSGTWTSAIVDSSGNVGAYTLLAIVDGKPAISYYDVTNFDLKYARNSAADGSGTWTPVTVDSTGNVGQYTSLAVLPDGRPAISYFDSTNFDLKWIVPEPVPLVSNTALLAGLNLSGSTLTPGFGPLDTLYSVFVPFATTSVSINSTAYHPSATIQINGTPLVPGGTASISLSAGANAVAILVTAPDGITTKTYSVNIYRGSSNAGLSSLVPDSTTLAPSFGANTTSYTATVPFATTALTLTPTADATATVTVNGSPVASGSPSSPIPLAIGPNVITTVVSAQDGFTTKTYTVTVTRLQLFPAATADFTGNVGRYTSQAIVDGKPAISYYDDTNDDLKYARNSAADGSGTWTTVTVDNLSLIVGQYTSLAVLPDGRPAISYYDSTNFDLKFARNSEVDGSGTWASTTVDFNGIFGQYTSLAIVGGKPAISYYDVTNGDLKFVLATDADGTSWATPVAVDSTGVVGQYTALKVLPDGRPAISYFDSTNSNLKFVAATDTSGTTWAMPVTVDSSGSVGLDTSLAIVGGNPAICYYDSSNGDLKYTRNSAADGSGTWNTATVDATGSVGKYASLAIVDGKPAISYYDDTNDDLKYVVATDASGSGWAAPVTVDSSGDVGLFTSLAVLPDGRPAISYYDSTNGDLKWIVPEPVQVAATTALLASLSLSAGTLSPAFGSLNAAYNVGVSSSVTSITVTPTSFDPNSTITVNGIAVSSGGTSAFIPLAVGANVINVICTAQDGITTKTHTITVTRAAPGLSSLTLSSGGLSPTFSTNTTAYSSSPANTINRIAVTPTVSEAGSTVTVNGVAVASGTASNFLPLAFGTNIVTVVVTAADGIATRTYTLTVNRANLIGIATVDFTGSVGQNTSQTIVGGNPAISYYDATNFDLKYTRNSAADGSGTWNTVTVDSTGSVGQHTSLRVLADGRPAISYYDVTNGDLKFVVATDTTGTAWSAPVTVDSTGNVGQYTSLVLLSDGRPAISYYDATNLDLKFVVATDASGTAWAAPVALGSTGNVGQYTSLTLLPNGRPAISYYDATNFDLKFVAATNANGTAWDPPLTVDSTGSVGLYTSLAIVGGNPAISYYDATNGALKFTRHSTPDLTGVWASVTVDTNGANLAGLHTSLATLADGRPAISYHDNTSGDLRFARNSAADGSGTWALATVESTGFVGTFTSLAVLADGNPAISYYDSTNLDLKWTRISQTGPANASLASLALGGGTLSPAFSTLVSNYSTSVPFSTTSITATPITEDSLATVQARINGSAFSPVLSGSPTSALPLNPGVNLIEIKVTAPDGLTVKTYTVTATRLAPLLAVEQGTGITNGGAKAFPAVIPGSSASLVFTLRNVGGLPLAISSVAVTGGDATVFTVDTTGMLTSLPATNDATTFTVTFAPLAAGPHSTTLRILSDDPVNGTFDIALSGSGINPDTTGPTGGTLSLSPTSPVNPGAALTASFADWTDPSAPLAYEIYIDDIIIGVQGPTATRNFTGPTTPGVHVLKGRIYDALNNFTEVTQNFTVNTPQESWRQTYFSTSANTGNAADLFDFDKDGLVNLIEYAFGLNPTQPDAHLMPQAQRVGNQLVISFTPPANVSGITYGAQTSETLAPGSWQPVPNTGTAPVHEFKVSMTDKPKKFVNLTITGQAEELAN